ncbi:P-loop NTPase fold protein [Dysgonomonas sp. ZJ279]|uniref:KAP family P-loop NTPase fold protein n=1 Tax=Dysgonomonas sp. ZJ279 TaxID=2709796 RepID=UPI0013ED6A31|nr:P-loop NTPase fold protein [Dysgonomonas sp. ZJ279]
MENTSKIPNFKERIKQNKNHIAATIISISAIFFFLEFCKNQILKYIIPFTESFNYESDSVKVFVVILVVLFVYYLYRYRLYLIHPNFFKSVLIITIVYSIYRIGIINHPEWDFIPFYGVFVYLDIIYMVSLTYLLVWLYLKVDDKLHDTHGLLEDSQTKKEDTFKYNDGYPINESGEEKFQRGPFAKRIAQTIYNYNNDKSLVIGLYGEWGTGKSSVLNLIQSRINEIDTNKDVIIIKFNPWRFSDDKSLLLSFFDTLAKTIDIEIKNKSEKIGEVIVKYAGLLAPLSGADDMAKTIGLSLSQGESIEVLKQRLDNAIRETKKKILIVIDDIDRLDKEEIYTLLRLVKLNADFPNSIYLLSFDEEMVAGAIGERFGEKGKKSGRNFLEKIVQVPLYLPKLIQADLITYSFEKITNTINSLNLKISTKDLEPFPFYFEDCIIPRITTPRLIIEYINLIGFSLPLLNKEVNISDLLLIESVKIFYPNYYQFIKGNVSYFLKLYNPQNGHHGEDKKFLKNKLEELAAELSIEEKKAILTLLKYLFPYLESLYANNDNSSMYRDWVKNKRICTGEYHERYFVYTVLKGDLSDAEFHNYIDGILDMEESICNKETYRLIENSSKSAFLNRLNVHFEDFSDITVNKICTAICSFGSKLSPNDHILSSFLSSQRQYARTIVGLASRDKDKTFECLKELLSKTDSIVFMQVIWDILEAQNKELFLTKGERDELAWILINRAKHESKLKPMFEIGQINTSVIFKLWYGLDKEGFTKYIRDSLEKKPSRVLSILKDSADRISQLGQDHYVNVSLNKNNYEHMRSIYDLDYLYDCIAKCFPSEVGKGVIWMEEMEEVKADNIYIGQFLHFYKEDKIK